MLPIAETNTVPDKPSVELPGLPKLYRLGTRAQDCIDSEHELKEVSTEFRLRAMKKREQLEDEDYGDKLAELQQTLWPVELLRSGDFLLDKPFEYKVEDQLTLHRCQGKVTKFIREKEGTHIIVEVRWNDKCLRDGDPRSTIEKLERTKLNPKTQVAGALRQDLYHKLLKID